MCLSEVTIGHLCKANVATAFLLPIILIQAQMTELKIFEKSDFGQIRVNQNEYGEPMFCLADVCKALKLQVQATKSRLSEKGVSSINTLTNGGVQSLLFINEQNLYKAIFQSRKKEAEKFTDWVTGEVLPTIRKTGKYEVAKPAPDINDPNYLTNRIMVAKFALEALNMNEVSKLAIVKSISKGYDLPLPEYAPSKGMLKCTTYLLKKIGADCSTRQFNEALIQMGMVQQNQRATPRGMKYFKSLTSDGLEFGENMVSPENPRETQIMLYEDKFSDLFEMYLDHIKF